MTQSVQQQKGWGCYIFPFKRYTPTLITSEIPDVTTPPPPLFFSDLVNNKTKSESTCRFEMNIQLHVYYNTYNAKCILIERTSKPSIDV